MPVHARDAPGQRSRKQIPSLKNTPKGPCCSNAARPFLFLREQGFTNVVLFAEGFEAWEKAGYPVEK